MKSITSFVVVLLLVGVSVHAEEKIDLNDKGIGPVKVLGLSANVDAAMAMSGKKIFTTKCASCHKIEKKYVGPALYEVTKRRAPEWIMNMILNPVVMTKENPIAKELLVKHHTQMTFQNVKEADARAILEFFRDNDAKPLPVKK